MPDQRHMTQGGFYRGTSPNNKQSVLVKRVMKDGRVVSGLESLHAKVASENQDEDQGTLGSVAGSAGREDNTMARESNIVNYGTADGTDSRMRSTMYITGKSQKFKIATGKNSKNSNQPVNASISKTMIINLGDRTVTNKFDFGNANNFGNAEIHQDGTVEMVVGETDVVTGISHVAHPNNRNFNPKMKHKQ